MNPYVEIFLLVCGISVGIALGAAMMLGLLKLFAGSANRRKVKSLMEIEKKEGDALLKAAKKRKELEKYTVKEEPVQAPKPKKKESLDERFRDMDNTMTDFIYDGEDGPKKMEKDRSGQDSSYEYLSGSGS